ncbi:MAG: serine hydrolase domain-containing protein [Salinivirgaceae bacterium]|nr:serine hydrolase domain-containing protein [Salinivirgaceae bacterium]
MKKNDVTGLSIALVYDQKVVWSEGFGYADKVGNVPATPETVYRVGSISKLFTATAVMQLAEQGIIDIDKPLQSYLPEFSIKSRFTDTGPITPRSIMTHHSGLPSELLKGMWNKSPEPFENEVKLLRDEYAAYPPNYVYSYSNVGVTILGHALEKVSGHDFSTHLTISLLQPLGMAHSKFDPAPDHSLLAAKAYRKGAEADELPLRVVPAGGLNSTVLDLSRFMKMVFAGGRVGERQIIKTETLAEMLHPQNADVPLDLDLRIGLGWFLGSLSGIDVKKTGPVAQHDGGTLYHRSQMIVLPEQKLGVVVLSNSATAGEVVCNVATEALKLAFEAKSGIRQHAQKQVKQRTGSLPKENLQAYEGRYATIAGVINVTRQADYLRTEVMGKAVRLVPRVDGLLGLQYRLLGLFPISLGQMDYDGFSVACVAGHDILKVRSLGQELLLGERIKLVPIPEKWVRRTGEYEIINRDDDAVLIDNLCLRQDNGLLIMDYTVPLFLDGRMGKAITPLSDTEAITYGLGRNMGETIRVVNVGSEELLRYSGYLLRKKRD